MRYMFAIVRVDLLGMWNNLIKGTRRKVLSAIFVFVFFFIFVGFVGFGGYKLADFIRDIFSDYPALVHLIEFNIFSATCIAAFIMLFLTGIRVVYGNFYESDDLSFLMSTPLPVRSVFGAKFLKSLGTSLVSLLPINGALWVGYGFAVSASPLYYVAVAITLLCVTSLFTALTALVVMIIMRFIPSQRMKQIIMVLSLLVALIAVFVGQYISVVTSGDTQIDPVQLLESTSGWGFEKTSYAPHVWMTKSMLLFVRGYSFGFFESLMPLLVLTGLLVVAAMIFAEWTFLTGWSQSKETDAGKELTSGKQLAAQERAFSGPTGAVYGILRKDMRVLFRSPMMWYNFLASLVIVGFMMYRMGMQSGEPSPEEIPLVAMLLLFLVLLMCGSVSGFASSFSVSLEGKAWWIMQHLPIKAGAFYLAKLCYGFIPSFVVGSILVLVLSFIPYIPSYPIYISLPTLVGVLSVQVAIALVIDIWNPDFSISLFTESLGGNRKGVGGMKVFVSMAASVLLVIVLAAIFSFPFYYDKIGLTDLTTNTAEVLTVIMFSAVVITVNYVCYFLGCRQLEKLFVGYDR